MLMDGKQILLNKTVTILLRIPNDNHHAYNSSHSSKNVISYKIFIKM